MLTQTVEFLNDLNRQYAAGSIEFHWSGYSDNCVHLVHNALAAASIWEPKSVNAIKIRQFFNMAIPANELYDSAFRLFVVELPLHLGSTHRAEELVGDPRFVDLRKNLEWYRSRYARIAWAHTRDEARVLAGDHEGPVRTRYDAYIRKQLDAVAAALARLDPSDG